MQRRIESSMCTLTLNSKSEAFEQMSRSCAQRLYSQASAAAAELLPPIAKFFACPAPGNASQTRVSWAPETPKIHSMDP